MHYTSLVHGACLIFLALFGMDDTVFIFVVFIFVVFIVVVFIVVALLT